MATRSTRVRHRGRPGSCAALLLVFVLVLGACSSSPERLDTAPPAGSAAPATAPPATVPPGTPPTTEATTTTTTTTVEPTTTTSSTTTTVVAAPTTVRTLPPTTPSRPIVVPTTRVVVPTAPAPTTPPAPPPAAPLPPGPTSVFVEGDSVLLGTMETLPAALVGWQVTMDPVGSRRLTQALPVLQARRGEIGRVVVIQLGNNYIPGEGGTFGGQINQAMSILDGVDRVVWVTLGEKLAGRAGLNAEIRAAAGRWSNIVVAEWAPLVAAHPEYAPGDGLHLSGSGRVAIADLIASAVGPAPG
jgi:hypothetical protein